jgi:ribulose-5-phosphate 4-epimerase/fuculose-1-phosphate aldolase
MDDPMSVERLAPPVRPDPSPPQSELDLRQDLAVAYRLNAHFGMNDLVFTHLSGRLAGDGHRSLVNPYGMLFEEIAASSLVVVDADGLATRNSSWPVNPAGFVIYSAIHLGRPDAVCVMHAHRLAGLAGMVVAAQQGGLPPLNQLSIELHGLVAEHDYEGIAAHDNLNEPEPLISDLGMQNCMVLRNHGLLTVGRSVAEAFYWMYYLEQSCRLQVLAQSTGVPLLSPPASIIVRTVAQFSSDAIKGWLPWQALHRKLDREQPDYRS